MQNIYRIILQKKIYWIYWKNMFKVGMHLIFIDYTTVYNFTFKNLPYNHHRAGPEICPIMMHETQLTSSWINMYNSCTILESIIILLYFIFTRVRSELNLIIAAVCLLELRSFQLQRRYRVQERLRGIVGDVGFPTQQPIPRIRNVATNCYTTAITIAKFLTRYIP